MYHVCLCFRIANDSYSVGELGFLSLRIIIGKDIVYHGCRLVIKSEEADLSNSVNSIHGEVKYEVKHEFFLDSGIGGSNHGSYE